MYAPDGYKPSRLAVMLAACLLAVLLIYGVYVNVRNSVAFSGEVAFSIGTTTRIYYSTSGRVIEYEYQYAGRTYRESSTYAYNAKVPGGRYFIKVSVESPEISKIYLEKPVPDSIIDAPQHGWRARPW